MDIFNSNQLLNSFNFSFTKQELQLSKIYSNNNFFKDNILNFVQYSNFHNFSSKFENVKNEFHC